MLRTTDQPPRVRKRVRLDRAGQVGTDPADYVAHRRGMLLHQRLSRLEAVEDGLWAERALAVLDDPDAEFFDVRTGEKVELGT